MRAARQGGVDWFDQVKRWPIAELAPHFGLEIERRGRDVSFACPVCGNVQRHSKSRSDKRRAAKVVHDGSGFWCEPCGATGDAVKLIAACVLGRVEVQGADEWAAVRRACAERGLCNPDPRDSRPVPKLRALPASRPATPARALERPPHAEVLALWNAGQPPWVASYSEAAEDRAAVAYIASRGINLGDLELYEPELCRVLPRAESYAFPKWWPNRWANVYRWSVLAYEPNGEVGSIHARAIGDADPRTRWPQGVAAGRLLFANRRGLTVLCGEATDATAVLITEGLSDTVAAAVRHARRGDRFAILGMTEGASSAFNAIRWPVGLECIVATDDDAKGDAYERKVRTALPASVRMTRVRITPLPVEEK